jgi:hypothetical protein
VTAHTLPRFVAVALAVTSIGSAGVAAAAGKSGDTKPGKGCGDKNHVHYKEAQCKKPH